MARMIPDHIDPEHPSRAERKLFALLQESLPGQWTVLHSLNIKNHPSQPWSEIDFVLIGPPGVFCLEVKGGRVRRVDGEWQYVDRNGQVARDRRGPFQQVQSATQALTRYIKNRHPELRDIAIMSGVMIPDSVIEGDGPDIVHDITYDFRSTEHPVEHYLGRVASYWKSVFSERMGFVPRGLSAREQEQVINLLRGDFDTRIALQPLIRFARRKLIRFTEAQFRVLDGLQANDRVAIYGTAGTGKTLLAIEEAKRWSRAGARVFLTCYNKNLAAFLKRALEGFDVSVEHFHSFLVRTVRTVGLEKEMPKATPDELFELFYPEACVTALLDSTHFLPYDVLIIDEAQDLLLPSYVDVYDALLRGGLSEGRWRVFLDPYQDIFRATGVSVPSRLLRNAASYTLTTNCRNTRRIAFTVSAVSGVDVTETINHPGPEVEVRFVRAAAEEHRLVSRSIKKLLGGGVDPRDIIILGHRRLENSAFANGFEDLRVPVQRFEEMIDDGAVRYATVQSFKGLESDVVIMTGLDDFQTDQRLLEIYVGLSRARSYLEMYVYNDAGSSYYDRYRHFGQKLMARGRQEIR